MACNEKRIVAYLSGDLDEAEKGAFEEHILSCDECWTAIKDDRKGRELAEHLRSIAPARVRERVRASVELSTGKGVRTRPRVLKVSVGALAAAIIAVTSTLLVVHNPGDPAIVTEVMALAESASVPTHAQHEVGGKPVMLSRYRLEGTEVVIARSTAPFPMPAHAMPLGKSAGEPWVARRAGMSLLCLSHPEHVLIAAKMDPSRLLAFARSLGLAP